MSGFDIAWLDLRGPADAAALDQHLRRRAADRAGGGLVIDLGAGTGAAWRSLSPLISPPARWRLFDHDIALLDEAQRRCGAVQTRVVDLAAGPPSLDGAQLVVAHALLDLVSADWVQALAIALPPDTALWAPLNYDGRMEWEPAHPLDAAICEVFNRHQHGDKGFGPALGPDSVPALHAALGKAGFHCQRADSAWRLGPGDAALVRELVTGIARAALECGLDQALVWRDFRLGHTRSAVIGHVDLFAYSATSE